MSDIFLEVVVNAEDAIATGIESRDEIEEPLEEALLESGLGEVSGGGGGSGVFVVDLEIKSEERLHEALDIIRGVLQKLNVPESTRIKRHKPQETSYTVY